MAETAREVAVGTLTPECAGDADLYPEPLLRATDAVLEAFEDEVRALQEPYDEVVFGTVERVVLALNAIDEDGQHGGAGFCTEEREQLCAYIDLTLAKHGRGCFGGEAGHRSVGDQRSLARMVIGVLYSNPSNRLLPIEPFRGLEVAGMTAAERSG
ncbi:hypothetical protein [Streptomyces sp. NPDC006527]|uniref:hypothetical protein n=1 Tax=Streptomyces sp. NPDC006527 TaxID=3364749 RepID=UPI00369DDCBD